MRKSVINHRHLVAGGLLGTFAALVCVLALASPAAASGSIQVTTTADEYGEGAACSLREAITAISNTASFGGCSYSSGADTVLLASGVYSLTRPPEPLIIDDKPDNDDGDLDILQSMTITVANGGRADVTMAGIEDRVLELPVSGVTVTVTNLTLRNGVAPSVGGGVILNKGTLLLDWVYVRFGDANFKGPGGGIWNFGGVMTITNGIVEFNTASGTGGLGSGGGIANSTSARLTLINTSIMNNTADSFGGGISNDSGFLVIRNSTINNNVANEDNGGGIYMSLGVATLNNVTISDNVASDSEMGAGGYGGGVYQQVGTFNFSNTLIVGNTAAQNGEDCYTEPGRSLTSYGYNILGTWVDDIECSILILGGSEVISNTAWQLEPVGYYASSLPTRALTSGSGPALDGGNPGGSGAECEATDQRGWLRSLAAPCDIGAFELVPLSTVFLPLVQR